jgi:hypothetical protein
MTMMMKKKTSILKVFLCILFLVAASPTNGAPLHDVIPPDDSNGMEKDSFHEDDVHSASTNQDDRELFLYFGGKTGLGKKGSNTYYGYGPGYGGYGHGYGYGGYGYGYGYGYVHDGGKGGEGATGKKGEGKDGYWYNGGYGGGKDGNGGKKGDGYGYGIVIDNEPDVDNDGDEGDGDIPSIGGDDDGELPTDGDDDDHVSKKNGFNGYEDAIGGKKGGKKTTQSKCKKGKNGKRGNQYGKKAKYVGGAIGDIMGDYLPQDSVTEISDDTGVTEIPGDGRSLYEEGDDDGFYCQESIPPAPVLPPVPTSTSPFASPVFSPIGSPVDFTVTGAPEGIPVPTDVPTKAPTKSPTSGPDPVIEVDESDRSNDDPRDSQAPSFSPL